MWAKWRSSKYKCAFLSKWWHFLIDKYQLFTITLRPISSQSFIQIISRYIGVDNFQMKIERQLIITQIMLKLGHHDITTIMQKLGHHYWIWFKYIFTMFPNNRIVPFHFEQNLTKAISDSRSGHNNIINSSLTWYYITTLFENAYWQ
jgi:hypothetical protein